MDKKNTGIIATVVTALLCGCPGLFGLCFGLISAAASQIPGAKIDVFGSSDPKSALTMGLITLCVSILFIAIPVVVGVVMLRKKPGEVAPVPTAETPPPSEPLPPAI